MSGERPSRDPPGFDRDGKATGPTHLRCTGCNAPPSQEHAIDCPMWQVKPQPLPIGERRVFAPDERFTARFIRIVATTWRGIEGT
jgi:hypothetical protein